MTDTLKSWDAVIATSFWVPVSSVLNVIKKCQRKLLMGVRSSQEQNLEMCIPVKPAQMWPPASLMCPHHIIQHQKGFVSGHVWMASPPPGEALRHHLSPVYKRVVKNLPGRRRGRSRVATNEPPHVVPNPNPNPVLELPKLFCPATKVPQKYCCLQANVSEFCRN